MTLPAKRLLYVLSFLAFAAISPALVLYAWGYRYDFVQQKVQVTGILYLKSFPRRATVTINGRAVPDLTPAQLTGLEPGQYSITVSREGMQTWRKTLVVRPQLATFAEDIVLFRNEPDSELVQAMPPATKLVSSPDGQLLASVAPGLVGPALELRVRDVNTNQIVAAQPVPPSLAPYSIVWSQSGRRLAVVGDRQALAVVIGNSLNPIVISPPTAAGSWLNLQWDSSNDNGLYAPSVKGLYRFDLATKRWQAVSRQPTLGLLQRGNASMAVVVASSTAWLVPWPTDRAGWKLALSSSTEAAFTGAASSDASIAWQAESRAWLIDASSSAPAIQASWDNVRQVTWSPHSATLAVLRPSEVALLHLQENASSSIPLANQAGGKTQLLWYSGGTHLYLSQPGLLEVAEIDPRGERNRHTLISDSGFSGAASPSFSSKYLYWVADGSASSTPAGLYRSTVQ